MRRNNRRTPPANPYRRLLVSSHASLEQDLAETRDRFCFPDAAQALKRCNHQDKVDEQTDAKRDKQKNAETTEPAISGHDRTKLAENRRTHKRFSHGQMP